MIFSRIVAKWLRAKKKNRGYTPRTEISNIKPFYYQAWSTEEQKKFYSAKMDLWIKRLEGEEE